MDVGGVKMLWTVMLTITAATMHVASALSAASNSINTIQHDSDWKQRIDSIAPGLFRSRISLTLFSPSLAGGGDHSTKLV